MTSESSEDDFENITKANYDKISQKMEKMGYKDGIHDGRESQFQRGFDEGYENGFRNGFLLGKYRGSQMKIPTNDKTNKPSDLILQRPSKGQCILCTDPSLGNSSIKEIVEKQTSHIEKIESTLKSRYADPFKP